MVQAALLLVLAPFAGLVPQDSAADAARLVPPGSFLTLRVESAERLHEFIGRFAAMGGEELPGDAAAMLSDLELPGDASQLDTSRPGYVALSLQGMATLPTFVVPVRDAAAFQASLAGDASLHTASLGGYVGVSQQPGYAALAEPNPLVTALRPGMASARLDLKTLIQTFRPMIEMGMNQLEMMMDQAAFEMEQDAPMDMAALLELYVDGIWAFLDSADQLDVALTYDGKVVQARSWLSTLPDSPMASFGGDQVFDLRPAARWIDPDAGFSMAMACDMAATMERFAPILDHALEAYPPELAGDLKRMMAAYAPVWPLLGNQAAATGDLGPGGLRASYQFLCPDPAALSAAMGEQLAKLAGESTSKAFTIAAPQAVEVGGKSAQRSMLTLDFEHMTESMLEGEDVEEEQLEQMNALMDAIYGKDGMQLVWQAVEERLTMALGGDEAYAAQTFAAQPGSLERMPVELREAIEAASGGSMGLVYRLDYGRLFGDMVPMFAQMGMEDLDVFAANDLSMPITFWMGIGKSTWSSGVGMDLDQLAAVVKVMREAEEASASDDSDD